ncbi:MAG: hypothetical protein WD603_01155 [Patescibacteria group bacterium]
MDVLDVVQWPTGPVLFILAILAGLLLFSKEFREAAWDTFAWMVNAAANVIVPTLYITFWVLMIGVFGALGLMSVVDLAIHQEFTTLGEFYADPWGYLAVFAGFGLFFSVLSLCSEVAYWLDGWEVWNFSVLKYSNEKRQGPSTERKLC